MSPALFLIFSLALPLSLMAKMEPSYRATLQTLDKKIREGEEKYLALEKRLAFLKKELTLKERELKKTQREKESLSRYKRSNILQTLERLSTDSSLSSFAHENLLLENYKELYKKRKKISKEEGGKLKGVSTLKNRVRSLEKLMYLEFQSFEKLKNQKKALMAKVKAEEKKERSSEIDHRIASIIDQKKTPDSQESHQKYNDPIRGYSKYELEEKGLEFFCLDTCDLMAVDQGRISHFSDVTPYGKMLMLEHPQGYKSIFLGGVKLGVLKMGDRVSRGQKIGTVSHNVYFELRQGGAPVDILSKILLY